MAWFLGATPADAVQTGVTILLFGVFVRTVLVWHITWAVNSVTHLWGYRSYETDEDSRNNIVVGLISNGEGWHNNHHADPRSARHGHRWWEIDNTWLTIRFLAADWPCHRRGGAECASRRDRPAGCGCADRTAFRPSSGSGRKAEVAPNQKYRKQPHAKKQWGAGMDALPAKTF